MSCGKCGSDWYLPYQSGFSRKMEPIGYTGNEIQFKGLPCAMVCVSKSKFVGKAGRLETQAELDIVAVLSHNCFCF